MVWSLLAEVVMVIHLAFIVFVAVGGFIALRVPQVAWLHAPAVVWSILVTITSWKCPLTTLEQYFHRLAGAGGYEGTYFQEYIYPMLYIDALAEGMQYVLAAVLVTANAITYYNVAANTVASGQAKDRLPGACGGNLGSRQPSERGFGLRRQCS